MKLLLVKTINYEVNSDICKRALQNHLIIISKKIKFFISKKILTNLLAAVTRRVNPNAKPRN